MSHNGRHIPAGTEGPGRRRAVIAIVGALLLLAIGAGILAAGSLTDDPTVAPPVTETSGATPAAP